MCADMLEWQINIMTNLGILAHQVKQLIGKTEWITVMQTDPLEAVDVTQRFHQLHNVRLAIEVVTVIGQVLGDKDKLLHALLGQAFGFFDEVVHRHRDMTTSY